MASGLPLRPGPISHGFDYYFGIPAPLEMALEKCNAIEGAYLGNN